MVYKSCKLIGVVVIVLAVLQGILVSVLPPDYLGYMAGISRFFEVMIPILAVGALLKYICCCKKCVDSENRPL